MLTFYGHDAIKVAQGTNRLPEILNDEKERWQEAQIWKCKTVADRTPHKIRLRGYKGVLLKSVSNDEARAIIERA